MKVCCVYIQAYLDYNVNTNEAKGSSKGKLRTSIIPLGISYISSALKQNGYNTYGVLFVQGIPFERIICDIYKDTDIICISITSYSCWIYAKQILNKLKEYLPKAKIIVGGTFVTLAPENIFKNEKIDALCIGEGEKAIVEYVKNYQANTLNKKIDNLYIRENGQIIKCDRSLFIEDIDKLPYPDRHIWDKWTYDRSQHKVLTERGCPNKCVYCANHKLANASQGTYLRHRNPIDIVNEIKSLKKDYPQTSSIMLYSENAASKLEHFIKLCQELKKYNDTLKDKINYTIILNVTKNLVKSKEVFTAIKEANIKWVMFGFESASKEIRKKINRPNYDNKDILKFCNEMKKAKIHTTIYAMLCYPYETTKSYFETVKWLRFFRPDAIGWFFMGPPKNTELYQRLIINKEEKDKINYWFNLKNWWYFITFKFRVYITYKPFIETIFLSTEQFGLFNNLFALWRKFINNKKIKAKDYQKLAKQYFDKQEYKQALKYYDKIKDRNEAWIYGDIAIAKCKIKKYKEALYEINKALKIDSGNNMFLKLKEEILIKYRGQKNARV